MSSVDRYITDEMLRETDISLEGIGPLDPHEMRVIVQTFLPDILQAHRADVLREAALAVSALGGAKGRTDEARQAYDAAFLLLMHLHDEAVPR